MTDKQRKSIVKRMIQTHKEDSKVKRKYYNDLLGAFLIHSLVVALYFVLYYMVHEYSSPSTFARMMLCMVFVNLVATFMMLINISGRRYPLSDGKNYKSFIGVVLKIVCIFEALVPMMFTAYYFTYDSITDTSDVPLWKIMIGGVVVFVGITLISAFEGLPSPYSERQVNGQDTMTKLDWSIMRQDQKMAGLDPDKVPVIMSPSQIKRMTKLDWYELGMDLKSAGYDVFKK